jgi:hypothetical protein
LPIWGILWQFNIGSCHSYGKLPIYKWYNIYNYWYDIYDIPLLIMIIMRMVHSKL